MSARKAKPFYLVPILSKALDIQELLEKAQKPMSLEDIYKAARCPKTTAYRILRTYVHRGYFSQNSEGLYRISSTPRKLRFGFAGQSDEMPFSRTVAESLRRAALASGIDLLVLDNHYEARAAVANARRFVQERVDLIIDFNSDLSVAAEIGDLVAAAGIPMIAVDLPHPHATYFGADNYRIGHSAGEVLARHAVETWKGKVSWVVGLGVAQSGDFISNRIAGAFDAIRKAIPDLPQEFFARADAAGKPDVSYKQTLGFLRRHPKEKGILIVSLNDSIALGAVQAVRELQRQKHVMVVGHDGIPEALEEMARRDSPMVGTVYTDMEQYGPQLIQLGLAILKGHAVTPYNFTDHRVIDRDSILQERLEAQA
ncbi:substrate-binding domain-containing protein [Occallatibacter savannae]|uniref:substrate-binding domain-containing protein n=1 Tax=Occallatibacter savannae TaxID=1002691 RepID=UPI000D68C284|nr:substrate-binding domain-containing protein [Occallatibacter savannae]